MSRFQDILARYTGAQPNAAPDVVADVMFLLDTYGKCCDVLDRERAMVRSVRAERDAALAELHTLRIQHGVERMSRDEAEAERDALREKHAEVIQWWAGQLEEAMTDRDKAEAARRESFTNLEAVRAAEAERDALRVSNNGIAFECDRAKRDRDKAEARAERARREAIEECIAQVQHAREEGETDHRQMIAWLRALPAPEAQR